jgi:hypothetical protein
MANGAEILSWLLLRDFTGKLNSLSLELSARLPFWLFSHPAFSINRRDILVFSANLSALTINHGEKKSLGPDLHLSYHDNDHYSSVRDNRAPIDQSGSASAAEEVTSNSIKKNGIAKKKKETRAMDAPDPPGILNNNEQDCTRQAKKGDPCPCGSGRKYKKCCLSKQKHAARVQKLRDTEPSTNESSEADKNTFEMNGNFRVLQI